MSLDPAATDPSNASGATVTVSPQTAAVAERLGVGAYGLEIVEVLDLAPSVRRIRVGASSGYSLAGFTCAPGQDLMLDIMDRGEWITRRRYTIRRFDDQRHVIDIDVMLHGEGPAARWAANAAPGMLMTAIGPRGKVTLDPDATWHLFIGDDTFAPATGAMLQGLRAGHRAVAILEVDSISDANAIGAEFPEADGILVRFVTRDGGPTAQATALLEGLEGLEIPATARHAYVAGEFHVVRAIRETLEAMGLSSDEISPKAYWRLGRANAENGEPIRTDG
jgi:NADPH-dependent ferric siderophore reductase